MVPMHKCEDALGKKKMEDGVYEQTKNKKKVIAFLLSMLMLISLFQNISYTPIAEGGETESVASESDANFATGQQSLGTQENQMVFL